MVSRKKFAIDILYSAIPTLVTQIRTFIFIPIITAYFGARGFGIWSQFSISLSIIFIFGGLRLSTAFNRFLPSASDNQVREDYYSSIILTVLTSTIISAFLYLYREQFSSIIFGDSEFAGIVILLAVVSVFNIYFKQTLSLLRSQRRILIISLFKSVRSIGEIAFMVSALYLFGTIYMMILSIVIFHVTLTIIITIIIIRRIGVALPKFKNIKKYLRFSLPLIFPAISYWGINSSDRYIITYFLDINAVGAYAVMYGLAAVISLPVSAISTVLYPDLSNLNDMDELKEYWTRIQYTIRYYIIFGFPAVVGLSVLGEPILRVLTTTEIAQRAGTMIWLTLAMITFGLLNILIQILKSKEDTIALGAMWGISAIFNAILNLILIPIFGITGAAVATLLSFAGGVGYIVREYPKSMKVSQWFLGKITFISLLMGTVVWVAKIIISPDSLIKTIFLVGLGVVLYSVLVIVIGVIGEREQRLFRSFIKENR